MSGGKNSPVPAATYELEHLATFAVSQSPGQVKPAEALERLREMESTSGVWAMKVILRVDCADINVIEQATLKVSVLLTIDSHRDDVDDDDDTKHTERSNSVNTRHGLLPRR